MKENVVGGNINGVIGRKKIILLILTNILKVNQYKERHIDIGIHVQNAIKEKMIPTIK